MRVCMTRKSAASNYLGLLSILWHWHVKYLVSKLAPNLCALHH